MYCIGAEEATADAKKSGLLSLWYAASIPPADDSNRI